jgi:5-methylcytosine-specific restriction endonuclease McrA
MAVLGFAPAEDEHAVCAEITPAELSGRVTVANVLRLLERQNYRCALTGRLLTPDLASLDHIVPVRCGGEHRIENAQVLHRNVNRAKTTMTNEEFIALCREVVEYAAQQNFN